MQHSHRRTIPILTSHDHFKAVTWWYPFHNPGSYSVFFVSKFVKSFNRKFVPGALNLNISFKCSIMRWIVHQFLLNRIRSQSRVARSSRTQYVWHAFFLGSKFWQSLYENIWYYGQTMSDVEETRWRLGCAWLLMIYVCSYSCFCITWRQA